VRDQLHKAREQVSISIISAPWHSANLVDTAQLDLATAPERMQFVITVPPRPAKLCLRARISLLKRGMVGGNPVLDLVVKLVRLHEDFHRFSFCRNVGESIVDSVSLPPTGLEVVGVLLRRFA
jgi:hypothetical protein